MRSRDVVVCLNGLKIVKRPSVYMIAMSGSALDHSLSLNFSLLSSLSKWLQVFFSSSSSAHALRFHSLPQYAVHPKHVRPLHSSYLQFLLCICALLLSCSVLFPSLLCISCIKFSPSNSYYSGKNLKRTPNVTIVE